MAKPFEQYDDIEPRCVAEEFLNRRRSAIQDRLNTTFRYVTPNHRNSEVFSYELASILRDAYSTFESVCTSTIRSGIAEQQPPGSLNISHYKQLPLQANPRLPSRMIRLDAAFPRDIVCPFIECSKKNKHLRWWRSNTELKHSALEKATSGNLRDAILAVAALAILKIELSGLIEDEAMWSEQHRVLNPDLESDDILFSYD
jgi:hypothetical protein